MSYEEKIQSKEETSKKLDIPTLKFLWQALPSPAEGHISMPKFLRNVEMLQNFTYRQLRILSQSMHRRSFKPQEIIFRQGYTGIGFYFIYSGYVDIVAEDIHTDSKDGRPRTALTHVATLGDFDHFGEMALIQENSVRAVTAMAHDNCELLGIFRPDLDAMLEQEPLVAAKLLQALSSIMAGRVYHLSQEIKSLKHRLAHLKENHGQHAR